MLHISGVHSHGVTPFRLSARLRILLIAFANFNDKMSKIKIFKE